MGQMVDGAWVRQQHLAATVQEAGVWTREASGAPGRVGS